VRQQGRTWKEMQLKNPARLRIKFISLVKRLQHRREWRAIQDTMADAEIQLQHNKQQLAFLYGLKAKRLYAMRLYDKCLDTLNHAIEVLVMVKKDNRDREALCVMITNLVRIYAELNDHRAAANAQENIIELYQEMLEARESVVIATNWELKIKDQMLTAKDKKLQEHLSKLQDNIRMLDAANAKLESLQKPSNGNNRLPARKRRPKQGSLTANSVGLAGDVGKLLGKHEYLGAFVLAMTLFEHEMVHWQSQHAYHFETVDKPLKERLEAVPRNLFDKQQWQSIETAIEMRHSLVHGGKQVIDKKRVSRVIEDLTDVGLQLRDECQDKKSVSS
jgi:tetratricopeptide (TPR) repeat protein